MELVRNTRVEFNELLHTYLLDGEKLLIGVTSLMKKHNLSADYGRISESVLNHAAQMGKMAHKALEDYDNGEPVVENELIRTYRALNLKVIASEYLISDNSLVASSIDKVLDTGIPMTVDLADVKRTSSIHKDALAWQLGIYKFLIELQNPGLKVRNCYCIPIQKGNKDDIDADRVKPLIPITPVSEDEVKGLLAAESMGLIYSLETATIMKLDVNAGAIQNYAETLDKVATIKESLKAMESKVKEFEEMVYTRMLEGNMDKCEVPGGIITLKRPYLKSNFDSASFKKDHKDLYEKYLKTNTVHGGITYKKNDKS